MRRSRHCQTREYPLSVTAAALRPLDRKEAIIQHPLQWIFLSLVINVSMSTLGIVSIPVCTVLESPYLYLFDVLQARNGLAR
jgi:hypothetical protein